MTGTNQFLIEMEDVKHSDLTEKLANSLIQAIEENNNDEIQKILKYNKNSNEILCYWIGGNYCATPLEFACKGATEDSMMEILRSIKDEHKIILGQIAKGSSNSPLHYAALNGNARILNMVIDIKATDVNLRNKNNQTALHLASRIGHESVVKILLQHSQIEIDPTDCSGVTPLQLAACNGHIKIVEQLLDRGANINNKSQHGITPLLGAASKGKIDVALKLLDSGADATVKDGDQDTALHFLRRKCTPELLKKLLQHGALLGTRNKMGITPLNGLNPDIIQQVLNESIKSEQIPEIEKGHGIYIKDDIKLQFKNPFATENHNTNETAALKNFIALSKSKKHETLVFHPLFAALIDMKWQVVKKLYFVRLFMFISFALFLSTHIFICTKLNVDKTGSINGTSINRNETSTDNIDDQSLTKFVGFLKEFIPFPLWFLLLTLSFFRLLETICRWKYNYKRPTHWLEIFLLILVFAHLLNEMKNLSVILLLVSWCTAFLHVSRYPAISPMFYIFCYICKNFIKFFFFSLLLLVGFLLSFHFVLRHGNNGFVTLSSSALKIASMILGEVGFEEFLKQEDYVIWAPLLGIFVFFICFVLFNMINGLAVSDTQDLRKRAEFATIVSQGEMVLSIEAQINDLCWDHLLLKYDILTVPKISMFYILPSTGLCLEALPDLSIKGKYLDLNIVENSTSLIESTISKITDLNELISQFDRLKDKISHLSNLQNNVL